MKKLILLLMAVAMLLGMTACGDAAAPAETEPAATESATEMTEAPTEAPAEATSPPETEVPVISTTESLANIWDVMDNEGVAEIELLAGLEVDDIDAWQKKSDFQEIKLYQRTIHETIRLGTIGNITVAQFVTNPDVYQTDYDYSGDPVWNVRMEKSDGLQNNTGIEIPEDAWYGTYTINRPKGQTVTQHYYEWVIEGSPEDTSAPAKVVALNLICFEDTQNLYSIYSDEVVFTWNGKSWDSNIQRLPEVVFSYIAADGNDYYKHITDYDLKHNRGDLRYFRIKMPGAVKEYQYEIGMTVAQWVKSKYNTDGWKTTPTSHGFYEVCSPDGKYKLSPDLFVYGVMYTH